MVGLDLVDYGLVADLVVDYKLDPRYGLILFSEIGVKALSPSINDYGTAINVLSPVLRILNIYQESLMNQKTEIEYKNTYIRKLDAKDLFDDFFAPMARSAINNTEVSIKLLKALKYLNTSRDPSIRSLAKEYATIVHNNITKNCFDNDRIRIRKILENFE